MSAAEHRQTVQAALQDGSFETTRFGSPEHGTVVECLMCEVLGLTRVDGPVADAQDTTGGDVQIKACKTMHSNGYDVTTPGRWDAWSDTLLELLKSRGRYLLVVYDGDQDPSTVGPDDFQSYIKAWRFLDAREFAALIPPESWHTAHREKGKRARISWTHVFEEVRHSR